MLDYKEEQTVNRMTRTANEEVGLGRIKLGTLAGGAIEERFGEAMDKVLVNIKDRNTDAKAKREITIKVTVTPDDLREVGDVDIGVETKLAGPRKVGTQLFVQHHKGKTVATENDPKQGRLFGDDGEPEEEEKEPTRQ